ncbi:MAG: molybdopterin molybdotransferase MoeA [Candidatus Rokubacteria bacterium]|nr:molybdopterin molybdotransferase MoeA [Candidatus Rokubacteria bacterium]
MLSVEEALERVLAVTPVLGCETVELTAALGRVLAEPVVAGRDLPPWNNSSMDGYALRASDTASATADRPARLRLLGEIPAGAVAEREVGSGEAYRILTGAPMPGGADAVIPQEEVRREGTVVVVPRPVGRGDFVRPQGEDIRAGESILASGALLGPAALGVLAALGRPLVRVYQRPRVAILSTGDELVDLGRVPGPGQIPNSNTYTLSAQVREAGGIPVNLGIARDAREELEERFRWGLTADVLVSSAGVSVGDRDFVRGVMEKLGAELDFWKVSMRPGKPLTFGRLGGRPFFGLPGNPVSSMVTFELFVRPALRRMGCHERLFRPRVRARLLAPLDNPGPRRGYLRVRLFDEGGQITARPTGEQGSGILRSMLLADGLAVLPPDTRVEAGMALEVILLRGDWAPSSRGT